MYWNYYSVGIFLYNIVQWRPLTLTKIILVVPPSQLFVKPSFFIFIFKTNKI
jgi:hypothetical protein